MRKFISYAWEYICSVMCKLIYSVKLHLALLWQVIIFLFHRDSQRHCSAKIIFYIKKEYHKNNLTLLGYSLSPLLLISIVYAVCDFVDILPCWVWAGNTFYPFVLAIGALIITIMIAININPKRIENGEQFIKCLIEHIFYLNYTETKSKKLYIITPNINIGAGIGADKNFSNIIKEHQCIEFNFICLPIEVETIKLYWKKEDSEKAGFLKNANERNKMLSFLYKRYNTTDANKLDNIMRELKLIILNNDENVNKNVKIHNCSVDLEEQQIGGYLSDFECVFGSYSNINKQEGEVNFKGEIITTEEFIDIIKEQMLKHFIP
jgi:hypothetical protein